MLIQYNIVVQSSGTDIIELKLWNQKMFDFDPRFIDSER